MLSPASGLCIKLGGNTHGTADPNWPRRYSMLIDIVFSNKSWRILWGRWDFWGYHVLRTCSPASGWKPACWWEVTELPSLLCLHTLLCFTYYTAFILTFSCLPLIYRNRDINNIAWLGEPAESQILVIQLLRELQWCNYHHNDCEEKKILQKGDLQERNETYGEIKWMEVPLPLCLCRLL